MSFRKTKIFILAIFFAQNLWAITLDFVDTPISEVVRAVSKAYDTPILVDDGLNFNVTFHLDGVGVLEGLTALCLANGLELVERESVFHVRRAVLRGTHEFEMSDSLVSISVKDKDVNEFISEFAANSGLNILATPGLLGKISGNLNSMNVQNAFRAIMIANGYKVWREKDCLMVSSKNLTDKNANEKINITRDGELYNVEINDGELADVLGELAEISGFNLAMYGEIREKVRLKFSDIDFKTLIESLFKGRRYGYTLDSLTLFVSEGGAQNALANFKMYSLKHIHSEKALTYLAKFLPNPNFIVTEIKEQNALLLGGTNSEIATVEDLLAKIDVATLQVTLSCIVVEFKRGKGFEIGLHSGSTRKTAERDIGFRGFMNFLNKDFAVSGAFGRIGLLPEKFELELASMEEENKAQVLARPRLTTLNGNKAELNVTNTVYYLVSQVSADGFPITDYRSFNDGISLELTPSVTREGHITLDVSPEIKTAGRSSGNGPRDISTRNLKTVVVLKDGETLCLGGLIRKSSSEVRSAVPFFGSLPIIGRLFSYTSQEEETNELAIFITPHVENVIAK